MRDAEIRVSSGGPDVVDHDRLEAVLAPSSRSSRRRRRRARRSGSRAHRDRAGVQPPHEDLVDELLGGLVRARVVEAQHDRGVHASSLAISSSLALERHEGGRRVVVGVHDLLRVAVEGHHDRPTPSSRARSTSSCSTAR